jgi:hypothetical protein
MKPNTLRPLAQRERFLRANLQEVTLLLSLPSPLPLARGRRCDITDVVFGNVII